MGSYRNEMDRRERLSREKGKRMAKERNAERNPSPAPMTATLADRLKRIAGEMERFLGPPEMAPGPDADDLTDAATALLALQSENTALRARMEEAEKVIRPFGKPWKPGMPRASRVDFEAAARWLEGK